jgi:hypothetical protein
MSGFSHDWWRALQRTKELGVNRKIESYKSAQRHLRDLYTAGVPTGPPHDMKPFTPADLEVVDVRPKWLCSTFGFHPMMGFRKVRQAESIAHGCATTLLRWQEVTRDPTTGPWAVAWGVDTARLDGAGVTGPMPRADIPYASGKCVFRADSLCPFSAPALRPLGLLPETTRELEAIYRACRRPQTHLR